MQCEIWFPGSEDWENVSTEAFLAKDSENGPEYASNVRAWDQKYSMSYTEFRAHVKRIAMSNWARMGCPVVEQPTNDPDFCYLITDDDDWFSPAIPKIVLPLFEQRPDLQIVRWQCWLCRMNNPPWQDGYADKYEVYSLGTGSNGFAVRGNVTPPVYAGLHSYVDQWEHKFVLDISDALSVWVRHPAAFCSVHFENLTDVAKAPRGLLPECLSWAADEVESLYNLVSSIGSLA